MTATPATPAGRLDGQRFFRVAERDFHYVMDEPCDGYSGSRPDVWAAAANYAAEVGETVIEERASKRLNDYVGPGVFGQSKIIANHPA